jgi:predicted membrane protein
MKYLLETVLSVTGLVIFFVFAFLISALFWVGFVILLVFEAAAFILGYFRRTKHPEQTLEEVVSTVGNGEK